MRLLNTHEAATLLGIKDETLRVWRYKGKGPRFIKTGADKQARVGYELEDIHSWLADRKFSSTSAYPRPTPISRNCLPNRASA